MTSFNEIDAATIGGSEGTTEAPVILNPAVEGSPVAGTGGTASVSADIYVFGAGVTVSSVTATLTPESGTPIDITLSAASGNTYSGSHTFPEYTSGSPYIYNVSILATDSNGATSTYVTSSFNITQAPEYCGDGAVNGSETCDDGADNGQPNYCNAMCDGNTASVCGNSVTESGETCDDGNTTTETCTYGQTGCTVCNATCQSIAGATSYCGDSTTDTSNGEACDAGASNTDTPCTPGYGSSCDYCTTSCLSQNVQGGYCGDGLVNGTEACDDGNTDTGDGCDASCLLEIPTVCGDGVTEGSEACDDGASNGAFGKCNTNCSASCTGTLLFSDNFDDGNYDGWTVADGSFTVTDGRLVPTGMSSELEKSFTPTQYQAIGVMVDMSTSWMSTEFKIENDTGGGITYGYSDMGVPLIGAYGGSGAGTEGVPGTINFGEWYTFSFVYYNGFADFYLNGEIASAGSDVSFHITGNFNLNKIILHDLPDEGAGYDNVKIYDISAEVGAGVCNLPSGS